MILPFYPSGKRGRPVKGIETMLCMYLMQIWLNLSDVAIEDAIYDSYAMRSFMRIDFNEENSSGLIVKKYFGYVKVAYRGLAKNFNRFNQRFLNSAP